MECDRYHLLRDVLRRPAPGQNHEPRPRVRAGHAIDAAPEHHRRGVDRVAAGPGGGIGAPRGEHTPRTQLRLAADRRTWAAGNPRQNFRDLYGELS
jgi:hypothetical protein